MDDGEIDLTKAAGPMPGEQVWTPQPAATATGPRVAAAAPQPEPEQANSLAEAAMEMLADEMVVHPAIEHGLVAAGVPEPISAMAGVGLLLLELADLNRRNGPIARPPAPPKSVPAPEQVWGPGGPSAAAPQCCRLAASVGRGCALHPSSTMG